LVDRAPRIAHRQFDQALEDVPVEEVKVGDALVVRAGEIVPVDGLIASSSAVIDESALTGEPIPVTRLEGEEVRSGTLSAGQTFSMKAMATAGESTYAGIVRLVTAAQAAKAPFILRTATPCCCCRSRSQYPEVLGF
jgi:P-type E1-E2 ATPase